MSWSHRLYKEFKNRYFIGAGTLVLPYNYQNIIQEYRPKAKDIHLQNFYQTDTYLLSGRTPLHKFKTNPTQLELLIDQYYKQRPISILSVLVKEVSNVNKAEISSR